MAVAKPIVTTGTVPVILGDPLPRPTPGRGLRIDDSGIDEPKCALALARVRVTT
jgi:hypothetical protein